MFEESDDSLKLKFIIKYLEREHNSCILHIIIIILSWIDRTIALNKNFNSHLPSKSVTHGFITFFLH